MSGPSDNQPPLRISVGRIDRHVHSIFSFHRIHTYRMPAISIVKAPVVAGRVSMTQTKRTTVYVLNRFSRTSSAGQSDVSERSVPFRHDSTRYWDRLLALVDRSRSIDGRISRIRRLIARAHSPHVATARCSRVMAEKKLFDLSDLENTVGSWDMYGQDDQKRYNGMQSEFFERAASGLTRREYLNALVALGGGAALLIWGAKGSVDAALPITKGPQKTAEVGPRGRI